MIREQLVFSILDACCLALAEAASHYPRPPSVLILATRATADSGVYRRTLLCIGSKFGVSFGRIEVLACPGLASLVEGGDNPKDARLLQIIETYVTAGFRPDLVALACTHYPAFLREIRSVLPARTVVLDPAHYLATHLRSFLASRDLLNPSSTPGRVYVELAEESDADRRKIRSFWTAHGGDITQLVDVRSHPSLSR